METINIPVEDLDPSFLPSAQDAIQTPIENFDRILSPFKNCFVHVSNFRGINLLPTDTPFILRQPELAIWDESKRKRRHLHNLILVPKGTKPRQNSSAIYGTPCELSDFFFGGDGTLSPCLMLKFSNFVSKSKTLNCQINIGIYPQEYHFLSTWDLKHPNGTYIQLGYLHSFGSPIPVNWEIYHMQPSAQPLNILIFEETYRKRNETELKSWLEDWMRRVNYGRCLITKDLFIFLETNERKPSANFSLRIVFASAVTIDLGPSDKSSYLNLRALENQFWNTTVEAMLSKIESYHAKPIVSWYHNDDNIDLEEDRSLNAQCSRNPYFIVWNYRQINSEIYNRKNEQRLLWDATVNILQLIFSNTSLIYNEYRAQFECVDINLRDSFGIIFSTQVEVALLRFDKTRYMNMPLTMKNPMRALKFISCGKPPQKTVGFEEFVIIYRWHVWLLIVVLIVGIFPVSFHFVEKLNLTIRAQHLRESLKQFSSNLFLQPIIILLEEGEAFVGNNLNLSSLQWMLGSLLIAGTVLSNAYKYDNVYNIIAPIKLLPYTHFRQLVSNNFTVHTMISVEGSDFNEFAWYLDNVTQINQHQIRGRFLLSNIQIESEVASLYLLDEFNTNVTGEYVTNSRLHPGILELFQKIQQENVTKNDRHKVFAGEQWKLVTDTVKVCNRSALILPELFALQLAQSMRKVDGLKYVFVGKDFLFAELISLEFRGWIPINIWAKIGSLESSGIWFWWENVIGSANGRVAEQEYVRAAEVAVEKPTMKGNVVVIFYLFCGVCGISIFSFVVESVENLQKQEWLKIDPNYENTDAQSLKFCVNDFRGVMGLEDRVKLNNSILTTIPILCGLEKEEKRYVITGSRWNSTSLSYRILSYPRRTAILGGQANIDKEFRKAFAVWENVTDFTFTKKNWGESDIKIRFLTGEHGDDDEFDAVEAHSFSPMFGNEIHFNDDREWNIGSFAGVDIFQTAGHYQRSDSIMYPNDVGYISNFSLHTDDVKAIQIIYGKKGKYSIPLWLAITWTALATVGIACMLLGVIVTVAVIFRYCKRKSGQRTALLEKSWLWDVEPEMDSEPTLEIDHSLNL
ncbi:Matrilysin [Orchesella cincta]|uniref:Matrilysin n=1 Tax=Orchesella cincta TaxID=48709 RepID=A0A1D2MG19_ORCCI|nr:Matrilysin [Orchesella cincta]